MDLRETIALMESADYKDRFKAEYYQLENRYRKLAAMISKYERGELDFEPACNIRLLKEQRDLMGKLLGLLELRAEIEGIMLY